MKKFSNLSIGTSNFNNQYGKYKKTSISNFQQENMLAKAWDYGFKFIDTAIGYKGVHQSLSNLNSFINNDWKLTTKIPPLKTEISKDKVNSWVSALIDESLNDLKVNKLNSVLIHDPSIESRPQELEYTLLALDSAFERGLIENYGISLYGPIKNNILKDYILNKESFIIQGPMNIFDRRMEDLTSSKYKNLKFEARSIFLQGMLLNLDMFEKYFGNIAEIRKFKRWIKKTNLNPIEACISFAKFSNADKIVIGFGNTDEIISFSKIFEIIDDYNPPIFCDDENIINPLNWT